MLNKHLKVYLKIHTHFGQNIANSNHYEILDDNTFFDKRSQCTQLPLTQRLIPFTLVFVPGVGTQIISNVMEVVSNCFNGIDQILIVKGTHHLKNSMTIGSIQKSGLLINLFEQILKQSHNSYQINSKVAISAFSTQGSKNQFVDLLIGSRFSFSSKKTFDNFKTFYERQITDMRQFLICLKIMLNRFQECCTSNDTFIFKVVIKNFDEFTSEYKDSTFHLLYSQEKSQKFIELIKRLQSLQSDIVSYGDDHGDMLNLIQKYIKSSQIKVLYQVENSVQCIYKNLETIKFLGSVHQKTIKSEYQVISRTKFKKQTLQEQLQKLFNNVQEKNNTFKHLKEGLSNNKSNLNSLSFKQSVKLQKVQQAYSKYLQQSTLKLKNYIELVTNDIQERNNSFQTVRFPVSLQIKDANLKNFYIAKIYGLSQKYSMPNNTSKYQKLKSIKNQVLLSTQTLKKHLLNQRACQILEQIFEKAALILQFSHKYMKTLLSLSANSIVLEKISLKDIQIQKVLHNQLLIKFDYTVRQKQEPHVRMHNFSIRKIIENNSLVVRQQNSFQNFNIYKANKIIGDNIKRVNRKSKQNQEQRKELKKNCTLPQILILKRKI